jgi:glycosyltransferase involved in cell wall biosynthesis
VYPHDYETRLTKAAGTLLRVGHRVSVFCKGTSDETRDGLNIRRFDASTLPVNPRWFFWLLRMLRQEGVEVVVVRDLRLAAATILAARRAGIPVIMDSGENHPAHVAALGKQHLGHYLIRNAALVAALERWCVRRADEVWVVTESNRKRIAALARNGTRVRVIRNFPELEAAPAPHASHPRAGPFRLVYLGILDNLRGLDMLLQALAETRDVELVLVGDGSERAKLEALADSLGIADRVRFCGWVSGPQRLEAVSAADVGVIPHRINYLTETTEPNKLFDYMLCGLPVLSTPLEPVAAVLTEEGCGTVAEYSPDAWANAIAKLASDRDACTEMGARGRRAVLERYNWERESRQVLEAIQDLA